MSVRFLSPLCLLLAFLPLSFSHATIITTPSGLLPGDSYRLVFVTSTTRDAQSTLISDYNTFVQTAANSVPALQALGTSWTALGSTASVDARDNTLSNPNVLTGERIFTLADTLVANDYADLWDGAILAPIDTTELGTTGGRFVWTGSNGFGVKDPFGFYLGSLTGVELGESTQTNGRWVATGRGPDNTIPQALYAISGVLTIVPEPSSVILLLSALCMSMGRHR